MGASGPGCARSTVARSTLARSPMPPSRSCRRSPPTRGSARSMSRCAGVADVDQRPHEPLPPRRHARGPGATGARSRARHRPRHDVGARLSPRPLDHARQRVDRRSVGRLRGVRRVAVLRVDLRITRVRRAVGLAVRRPPRVRQHRRVRRSHRDDAGVHGRRAATHRSRSARRSVAVRSRGATRARPHPLVRRTAARPGDHPPVAASRRDLTEPAEPVRRPDAGGRVPRQPRRAAARRARHRHDRRAATRAARR